MSPISNNFAGTDNLSDLGDQGEGLSYRIPGLEFPYCLKHLGNIFGLHVLFQGANPGVSYCYRECIESKI